MSLCLCLSQDVELTAVKLFEAKKSINADALM